MLEIRYNNTQIKELKDNKYVQNCTQKHIIFSKECKNKAIKLLQQNLSTKEIFEKLGFPEYIINSKIPAKSLNRWKRILRENGITELKKGRPKKEKIDFDNMTLEQENEYLKAKLALYEELEKHIKGGYP